MLYSIYTVRGLNGMDLYEVDIKFIMNVERLLLMHCYKRYEEQNRGSRDNTQISS